MRQQLDGRAVIGCSAPCVTRQWFSTGTAIDELRVWRVSARVIARQSGPRHEALASTPARGWRTGYGAHHGALHLRIADRRLAGWARSRDALNAKLDTALAAMDGVRLLTRRLRS